VKRKDAERLLCDLANIQDFATRYPQLFVGDRNPEETATVLRQLLRRAWQARDQRHRDWYCHGIASYYHHGRPDRDLKESLGPAIARGVLEPSSLLFALREPPRRPTTLESALLYFKKNCNRARRCPSDDCLAPYFVARKKNQKYCSPACVKPAQRATKRRWWKKHRAKKVLT
jgi:hypothetical protein